MSRRNTYFIPATLDADASAYIATGITDATERTAINQFFKDLKSYSIYTKFYNLYLLVAGSSTTRKFNLVNPLDTNAAFRLSFQGGWSHGSTGSTPNGSTGYADTFLIPSLAVNLNDVAKSIYCDTESDALIIDCGTTDGTSRFDVLLRNSNQLTASLNQSGTSGISNSLSRGMFTFSRTASTLTTIYRNGASIGTHSVVADGRVNTYSDWLGGRNALGSLQFPSNRRYRLYAVHTSMNATEAANFNIAVQTLMTSLGI